MPRAPENSVSPDPATARSTWIYTRDHPPSATRPERYVRVGSATCSLCRERGATRFARHGCVCRRSAERNFLSCREGSAGSLARVQWKATAVGAALALGVGAFGFALANQAGGSGTPASDTTNTPAVSKTVPSPTVTATPSPAARPAPVAKKPARSVTRRACRSDSDPTGSDTPSCGSGDNQAGDRNSGDSSGDNQAGDGKSGGA
jgi:hypothetical protein